MTVQQFKLPDLGEGLTEGDILKWTVAVGDTIDVNDTIAEVETVKAAVELPSPWAGVVTALHAAEGDTVPVGTPIISIDTSGGGNGAADVARTPAETDAGADDMVPGLPGETGSAAPGEEKQMTLVGYGPREDAGGRRRRRPAAAAAATGAQTAFNVPPGSSAHEGPAPDVEEPEEPARGRATAHRVLAKPPVRKLAKTLGVDLTSVTPTGPDGTISRDDVQSAANGVAPAAPRHGSRETRVPIKSVRKHMAAAMVASAFTAPHVTEFLTCDVTATMELRDRIAARRDFAGVKVSPLVLVARAAMIAMRNTPELNATWDDAAGEVVLKHYVNLGIAAATDRGLVVPNIKDADQLSLHDLAGAIGTLSETARAGRTAPADMTGGSFTITNVGVFGVDTGTPIINPGESAILAFGAVRRMPWVVSGRGTAEGGLRPEQDMERIEPRWVTQLAVSFDHRLVDGQLGSRFLADLAAILTDPGLALL
jgi:2-oxoisovalerate dehydrogenase E2 component (dihydrolipoyl transacylase)